MKLSISLRTRLVTLFLALGLIPLGIFALVSMKQSASALTSTSGDAMESVATQTLIAIETQLNERYSDVQAFASTTKLEPERLHVLPGRLNAFVGMYTQYDLMLVLDAGGQVLAVNSKDHAGNTCLQQQPCWDATSPASRFSAPACPGRSPRASRITRM
jgi:nitrogen fixation/metabolism regulation signal transduction histidine kinase